MNQNGPERINTPYALSAQLLEKFKPNFKDAEMVEAVEALKRGDPTEFQLEVVLAEIKNLNIRVKSLAQPEYVNAFVRRDIENELELTSDKEKLIEVEQNLYEALVKINPMRSRDYKGTSEEEAEFANNLN